MATGTAATAARQTHLQVVHMIRKTMAWDGTTASAVTVGILPANAVIIPNASGAFVTTAFAADTTAQTLDIGYADDADEYASALVLTTAGQIELDVETDLLIPADRTITATMTAGTAPTAGSLEVIISYVCDNDG